MHLGEGAAINSASTFVTGSSYRNSRHNSKTEIGAAACRLTHSPESTSASNFEYRYVTVGNGTDAFALEREVQRGALSVGKPFLNPL